MKASMHSFPLFFAALLLVLLMQGELVSAGKKWKKKFKIKKPIKRFNSAVKKTTSYAESVGQTAVKQAESVGQTVVKQAEKTVKTVVTVTEKVADEVVAEIQDVGESVAEAVTDVADSAAALLSRVDDLPYFSHFESFGNVVGKSFDQGLGNLSKGFHMAEGFAQQGLQCLEEAAEDIDNSMKNEVQQGLIAAKNGLSIALNTVESEVEEVYKAAARDIKKMGDDAIAFTNEVMDAAYNAYQFIEDQVEYALNFLEDCFLSGDVVGCIPIIGEFLDAIKEFIAKIKSKAASVETALVEMGQVMEEGFSKFGSSVEDYFTGVFTDLFTDPGCDKLAMPIPYDELNVALEFLKPFGLRYNFDREIPLFCEPKANMFINDDLEAIQDALTDMVIGLRDPALDLLRKENRLRRLDDGPPVEYVCLALAYSYKLGAAPDGLLAPFKYLAGTIEAKWCPGYGADFFPGSLSFAVKIGHDPSAQEPVHEFGLGFTPLEIVSSAGNTDIGGFAAGGLEFGIAGEFSIKSKVGGMKLGIKMTGEMAFSDRGVGGAFNLGYGSGIDLIQISSTPTTNPLDFFPPLTPTTDVETAFEYLSVSCSLDFGELPKRRSLLEDAFAGNTSRGLLALPVEGNSFPIPARLGGGLVRTSGSCWYQSPHDRFICPVYSDERIDDGVRDGTVLRLIGSTGCEVIATRIDHWAWGDQRYFHFRTDPSVSSDMLNACFAKESAIDVKYGPETLVYPPMASGVSKLDRTGGGCAWETGYSRWRCPINPTTVIKSGTGSQYVQLTGSGCSIAAQVVHWAWNGNGLYFKPTAGASAPVNTCLGASAQIKAYYLPEAPSLHPNAGFDLVRNSNNCGWQGAYQRWRCPLVGRSSEIRNGSGEIVRLGGKGCSMLVHVIHWAWNKNTLYFKHDEGSNAPVNTCLPQGSSIIPGDLHACDKCKEHAHCGVDGSCECDPGYEGDGFTCTDVDECMTGIHECLETARCVNSIGGYLCECVGGLVGDGHTSCDPPKSASLAAALASANTLPDKPLLQFFLKTDNGLCLTVGAEESTIVDFAPCASVSSLNRSSQLWSSVEGMLMSAKYPGSFLMVGDYYRLILAPLEKDGLIPAKFLWHISPGGYLKNEHWIHSEKHKVTWLSEDFLLQRKSTNECLTRGSNSVASFQQCRGGVDQTHVLSASGTIQNMALAETNSAPLVLVFSGSMFKYMHVADTQEFKASPKKFYLNQEGKLVNVETGLCVSPTAGLLACDDVGNLASNFHLSDTPSMIVSMNDAKVLECLDGGELKVTSANALQVENQMFNLNSEGRIIRYKGYLCLGLKKSGSTFWPWFDSCESAALVPFDYDDDTMQIFTFVQEADGTACKAGDDDIGCKQYCLDFDPQVLDAGGKIQRLVLCDQTKGSQQFLF